MAEAVSHTPERVWCLGRTRWSAPDTAQLDTAEGGLLLVRTGDTGSFWALGAAELHEGRHLLRYEVVASHQDGGNMHFGICDGDAPAARALLAAGGAALAFHPWDGMLHR